VQQVEGVPSLPVHTNNKFSCLTVNTLPETNEEEVGYEVTPKEEEKTKKVKKAQWEKRLPRELTVANTPSAHSLHIKVQVQATDTAQIHGADSLVHCGTNRLFLDVNYVQDCKIDMK
jgi:hypothetical protein